MKEEDTGLTMEEFLEQLATSTADGWIEEIHDGIQEMGRTFRPHVAEAEKVLQGAEATERLMAHANQVTAMIVTVYEHTRMDPHNPEYDWQFRFVATAMSILVALAMWEGYTIGKEEK
jgi:hypothetical protein